MVDKVNELTAIVNRFYPENPELPGSLERNEIITLKLQELTSGVNNQWTKLVKSIEEAQKLPVRNWAFLQFPNYKLTVEFGETTYPDHITSTRALVLIISLLGPYYTVYFEDIYTISNVISDTNRRPAQFKIVFTEVTPELFPTASEYLATLKKMTTDYFPDYQYLHHKFLMRRKVEGLYQLPSEIDNGPHTFFKYLFNNQPEFLVDIKD